MGFNVCVAGATGNVGRTMLQILDERNFPVDRLRLLASSRSRGKKMTFKGAEIKVEELAPDSFEKGEIVLSSPGGEVSKWYAPTAAASGALVIDNTSAFRMDGDVPLVVPEVNPGDARGHKGIIANPNCSTIQMVVVLKPIHDAASIRRVVVSTYQAVSGAGIAAINELREQSRAVIDGDGVECSVFPYQIAFNCLPQIPQKNAFGDNFYSEEEMKMVNETRKIMKDDSIRLTATTVRVPVFTSHSEAVNIETGRKLTRDEVIAILGKAPGVTVIDDPDGQLYPLAVDAAGKDDTFVGRIREDISHEKAVDMWIVSDNLRKGAALNAVQIAELFL
ncbi:MAG: aspartate-semialdehyde dehydrogenase [Candidatus Latescibacteria bacterium]|nr:aspartate-semialdehyde dehydrogenase [Candidatus Latescibacterota bacterium]